MSLRPRREDERKRDVNARLHVALSAGIARNNTPIGMMGDMHDNRGMHSMRTAHPSVFFHTAPRKVMMLKGLVFGIPDAKFKEAFDTAVDVIQKEGITTICWDGDKYTYPGADGAPAAASFTRLIPALQQAMPHLEFIYFKKQGKGYGLISGMDTPEADKFGNVLGPFPFMTAENTQIISGDSATVPKKMHGMHYGVEFAGDMKWYELGLKGLVWLKDVVGVQRVSYMVFGLGGAVSKELEKVKENPSIYPHGISEDQLKVIEVVR